MEASEQDLQFASQRGVPVLGIGRIVLGAETYIRTRRKRQAEASKTTIRQEIFYQPGVLLPVRAEGCAVTR